MTCCALALLASLSVWDYPSRQAAHEAARAEYLSAAKAGAVDEMEYVCEKGTDLLPDDPVWHYNLACALARNGKADKAMDTLETAVRLGFRDADSIARDDDFASVAGTERFKEIVEDARHLKDKPIFMGPNASIPAEAVAGAAVVIGEQNLVWDLESGCFVANVKIDDTARPVQYAAAPGATAVPDGAQPTGGTGPARNAGELYFNRDNNHSVLDVKEFPGLSAASFDSTGRERRMALDFPNTLFPCPVFGNCSRAMTTGPMWRSMPRALMTTEARRMPLMHKFYISNQIWVFPAVDDAGPGAKFGDVFASASPYWIATEGRSWSDLPYLRAALEVSRTLKPETKKAVVSRGLLAPTVQALLRKSLKGVKDEAAYLTQKAHPTAFPANGIDLARLKKLAAEMEPEDVPPLAPIVAVVSDRPKKPVGTLPELTYLTPCAWAIVLRADDETRRFGISATGGSEIAFAKVHGAMGSAEITNVAPGRAVVTLHTSEMSPVCRVDIAVFAKTPTSLWGAPSFVSFAVVDPGAPYSDPVLTPPQELAPQPGRPRPGKDAPDTPSKDETGTPPSGGPRPPGARP